MGWSPSLAGLGAPAPTPPHAVGPTLAPVNTSIRAKPSSCPRRAASTGRCLTPLDGYVLGQHLDPAFRAHVGKTVTHADAAAGPGRADAARARGPSAPTLPVYAIAVGKLAVGDPPGESADVRPLLRACAPSACMPSKWSWEPTRPFRGNAQAPLPQSPPLRTAKLSMTTSRAPYNFHGFPYCSRNASTFALLQHPERGLPVRV